MEPFNKLTPAEAERLAYLMEECGAVVQACSKILRHGYNSYNPDSEELGSNRQQLSKELIDVFNAIERMEDNKDLVMHLYPRHIRKGKSNRYMHHQE